MNYSVRFPGSCAHVEFERRMRRKRYKYAQKDVQKLGQSSDVTRIDRIQ
jgi:hypothetical protein